MVRPNQYKLLIAIEIDPVGLIIPPEAVDVAAIAHIDESQTTHLSILPLRAVYIHIVIH